MVEEFDAELPCPDRAGAPEGSHHVFDGRS
jgi:hypothetical protein